MIVYGCVCMVVCVCSAPRVHDYLLSGARVEDGADRVYDPPRERRHVHHMHERRPLRVMSTERLDEIEARRERRALEALDRKVAEVDKDA